MQAPSPHWHDVFTALLYWRSQTCLVIAHLQPVGSSSWGDELPLATRTLWASQAEHASEARARWSSPHGADAQSTPLPCILGPPTQGAGKPQTGRPHALLSPRLLLWRRMEAKDASSPRITRVLQGACCTYWPSLMSFASVTRTPRQAAITPCTPREPRDPPRGGWHCLLPPPSRTGRVTPRCSASLPTWSRMELCTIGTQLATTQKQVTWPRCRDILVRGTLTALPSPQHSLP